MVTTDEYIDYDRRADEIFDLINNGMTRDQVAKKFNYENIRSMDQLMRRRGYRIVKNKYVKADKEKPAVCKIPLRTEKLMDALNKSVKDGTEISDATLIKWGFQTRQQLNDYMKSEGVKFDPLNKRYYILPKNMDDSATSYESDFGPCNLDEKISILKEENRKEAEAKKCVIPVENAMQVSPQTNAGMSANFQKSSSSNRAFQTLFNNKRNIQSQFNSNGTDTNQGDDVNHTVNENQTSTHPNHTSNENNTQDNDLTNDSLIAGEQSDLPEKIEDFIPFINFLYNNKSIFDYMIRIKNEGKPFSITIPGKCVQKTFHINFNLACLINRFADEHGMKYKQVIEAAVVEYLNKYGYGDDLYEIINR